MAVLADRAARERAAVVTDRNVVVTAGAGTGKTTLLVDRLTHLLLREPDPLDMAEIVALTFTNKAANEMKLRLRERLGALRALSFHEPPATPAQRREWECLIALRDRYGLSKTQIAERASTALGNLERSQIGTIHSFAAHLLRLYPIQAGVDPAFRQDEGDGLKDFFKEQWDLWLDREFGPQGLHQDQWRMLLGFASLTDLQQLAWGLVGELIPLEETLGESDGAPIPPAIRGWLIELAEEAAALRQSHARTNILEAMLDLAAQQLRRVAEDGGPWQVPEEEAGLSRDIPPRTKDWSRVEHERAKTVLRIAAMLGNLDAQNLTPALTLLAPFAVACRRAFLLSGAISFDGLLARARDLLTSHPVVRRALKKTFRAILVDEFQDTDPVQYEIILCLAEALGREEADWRDFHLAPGKLFVVGDPKQSIYAFRRADMEAYDTVVDEVILRQDPPAARETLQTNFRSHAGLIRTVNAFFAGIFPERSQRGVQPQHEALRAHDDERIPLQAETVQLRLVRVDEPDADVDMATRAEAENLARWLSEALGRDEIIHDGMRVTMKPGHVAILFRTLTSVRDYVEAFRRHGLPCLTEGESHFYERQEVVDAVNVLRAATYPHDQLALVAVLRSPVGGLTDGQIEALAREGQLDYRRDGGAAAELFARLRTLHRDVARLPLTEVLPHLFARLPVRELAAASADREQALANLIKLGDLGTSLAARGDMTLSEFVEALTRRLTEVSQEAESALTEESPELAEIGAIRLLTIHKAKGLEFPVVVLAGLHRGTDSRDAHVMVQHDWSSGIVGLKLGDRHTLGGLYLASKLTERQQAEQARLLYVGMTRARRRLILSAGLSKSVLSDSSLRMIADRLELDLAALEAPSDRSMVLGEGSMQVSVMSGRSLAPSSVIPDTTGWHETNEDLSEWIAGWRNRTARDTAAQTFVPFLTPTGLQAWKGREARRAFLPDRKRARVLGTLAHRVLEQWNFAGDPAALPVRAEDLCRASLPGETSQDLFDLVSELSVMFTTFAGSEPYATLRGATILGREVPFKIPWPLAADGRACVMEGVIDVLYRLDGDLWIADYKTDRAKPDEVQAKVEEYRVQAEVYRQAVSQCLGHEKVRVKFIFLRSGHAIEVT